MILIENLFVKGAWLEAFAQLASSVSFCALLITKFAALIERVVLPTQNCLLPIMCGFFQTFQILGAIVGSFAIFMMHDFAFAEYSPKFLFHDQSMFIKICVTDADPNIATLHQIPTATPTIMVGAFSSRAAAFRAKFCRVFTVWVNSEFSAAKLAD